jgi:hypothetical protein
VPLDNVHACFGRPHDERDSFATMINSRSRV